MASLLATCFRVKLYQGIPWTGLARTRSQLRIRQEGDEDDELDMYDDFARPSAISSLDGAGHSFGTTINAVDYLLGESPTSSLEPVAVQAGLTQQVSIPAIITYGDDLENQGTIGVGISLHGNDREVQRNVFCTYQQPISHSFSAAAVVAIGTRPLCMLSIGNIVPSNYTQVEVGCGLEHWDPVLSVTAKRWFDQTSCGSLSWKSSTVSSHNSARLSYIQLFSFPNISGQPFPIPVPTNKTKSKSSTIKNATPIIPTTQETSQRPSTNQLQCMNVIVESCVEMHADINRTYIGSKALYMPPNSRMGQETWVYVSINASGYDGLWYECGVQYDIPSRLSRACTASTDGGGVLGGKAAGPPSTPVLGWWRSGTDFKRWLVDRVSAKSKHHGSSGGKLGDTNPLGRVGLGVGVRSNGIVLNMWLQTHAISFSLPIVIFDSDRLPSWLLTISPSNGLATLATLTISVGCAGAFAAHRLCKIYEVLTFMRKAKHSIERDRFEERARNCQQAMKATAKENTDRESSESGLVILQGWYGDNDCVRSAAVNESLPDEKKNLILDVTTPLQFFVRSSALHLASRSKAGMLGFFDPCVDNPRPTGKSKLLYVQYRLKGVIDSIFVQDDQPLTLPAPLS